jgi:DNA-binding transcriptional regulator LsrR (DeoR family)
MKGIWESSNGRYENMTVQEKWSILATVANLYYNSEMTQNEIADRMYTSRSKISRMLKEARELGIVEISIKEPWERDLDLEHRIQQTYGVKTKELKESLIQDDTIKTALNLAQNADVILTSVGSIEYKTWENYLGESTFQLLGSKGAICHIGGHFYDINGKELNTSLTDRMIGITYNDLEKCKNVVCVAYGEAKAKPIAGALRGGFINTLIIDSACGEKLLEQ